MIPQAPMVESRPLSESEWALLNAGVNPPGVDIVLVVGYGFRAKVPEFVVVADTSDHGLPVGAHVFPCEGPEWSEDDTWYSMGGPEHAVSIAPADIEKVA